MIKANSNNEVIYIYRKDASGNSTNVSLIKNGSGDIVYLDPVKSTREDNGVRECDFQGPNSNNKIIPNNTKWDIDGSGKKENFSSTESTITTSYDHITLSSINAIKIYNPLNLLQKSSYYVLYTRIFFNNETIALDEINRGKDNVSFKFSKIQGHSAEWSKEIKIDRLDGSHCCYVDSDMVGIYNNPNSLTLYFWVQPKSGLWASIVGDYFEESDVDSTSDALKYKRSLVSDPIKLSESDSATSFNITLDTGIPNYDGIYCDSSNHYYINDSRQLSYAYLTTTTTKTTKITKVERQEPWSDYYFYAYFEATSKPISIIWNNSTYKGISNVSGNEYYVSIRNRSPIPKVEDELILNY